MKAAKAKCAERGCKRPAYALGWCEPAYRRLVRAAAKKRGPVAKPKERQITIGVRVFKSVADKLASTGEAATTAARKVLEGWAATRR